MGYKAFILFYLILIETFVELMIKAMDMELLDWLLFNEWQISKVIALAAILLYQAFFRWVPFLAMRNFKKDSSKENFIGTMKASNIPWFFFANLGHAVLLMIFALVCYKLNKNAWPLYSILYIGAAEVLIYLLVGIFFKLFAIGMGSHSIILSRGYLTLIPFRDLKRIERKYVDELYFIMANGKVNSINYQTLNKKEMTEFLVKLKINADKHDVYLANDVVGGEK
jgi:hypothetical protein